jgi:membrane-associated PAP2 superfamily phosphatase
MSQTTRNPLLLDLAVAGTVLLVASLLFRLLPWDLAIAGHFFVPGARWPLADAAWVKAAYVGGLIPAHVMGWGALGCTVASLWHAPWRPHRRALLVLFLGVLLGPGLLVNEVFKEHWGRPRPRDVVQFGGTETFLSLWTPGRDGGSFPSGHASMGFALMLPYFVLRRRRPRAAFAWFAFGLAAGAFMGVVRIVAGGHFASDVLWAGGMVYLVGAGLAFWLRPEAEPAAPESQVPATTGP